MKLKPGWREGKTPEEIRRVEQLLVERERLHEENPLAAVRFYPKQERYVASKHFYKLFAAGNGCLAAGTLVRMGDGSVRPIEDIEPGDRVVGVDMDGTARPVDVIKRWDNGVKPLVSYRFNRGRCAAEVVATKDHRFLVDQHNGAYQRRGEELSAWYRAPRPTGFEPDHGDRSLEKWALLWGLLLGDGSFTPNVNGGGRRVTFHNTESDLLDLAEGEAKALGLGVCRYPDRLVLTCNGAPKGWFYDFLEEHHFDRKAHEKAIPDCVFGWSNEAVGRLIAGLWLSDGTASRHKASIELSTPVMVEQIRELLEVRFGVYCNSTVFRKGRKATHNDQFTLGFATNAAASRFLEHVPLVGRKRDAMVELAEVAKRVTDSRFLRFESATEVAEGPTYDLFVDHPNHMFLLANGVVVSNSGKTFTGTADDLIQLCDRSVLPRRLQRFKRWEPPFHMRIVVPKFGLAESVALEKFRELTPKDQFLGGNFDKAYDKVNRKLRFQNGSWVVFNTSDQDVNAHAGVELHRVRFDEEPEGELGYRIFNENLMRLRKAMPDAQVCMTFTPQNGLGWTYELFWEERGEEVEDNVFETDRMLIVVASMLDNPHIDGQQLLDMADLPPEEYAARVEGKFVSFHGRVLAVDEEHKVSPPERRHVQGLETWVGIDPGIARGGVVWVGFDRDNVALVYDELYPKDLTVPEIAQRIKETNDKWGVKPRAYVIDPSARNRSLTNAESVESLFLREGIPTLHGQNDRRAGVMQLRARLGQRGILISRSCVDLLKETERWVVAEDEKLAEEKPSAGGDSFKTKGPDHLCDPLRYVCMERLWYRRPEDKKKLWNPSMGGAPPASYYTHENLKSGPPLGSMT